jgi:hypothetical protein
VKNGLDFDLACSLEDQERAAFCIRFGMFEGGVFDWQTGDWAEADE